MKAPLEARVDDQAKPSMPLETALLLLIFNRPDQTAQVFAAIRAARPVRLYVAADGPRPDRPGEVERCAQAREIATAVDWPCEVSILFRDSNLGCKRAVSGALDWFFGEEEAGIVLEDDCLPHSDFFSFCEALLERYAEDERVSVITGDNFQHGRRRGDASYYFSKYNHVWGWASWRRAWQLYDREMSFWPDWKGSMAWHKRIPDAVERNYWEAIFDRFRRGEIDTWDYSWTASLWYRGGLTATPNMNLVTNIGIGPDATHTLAVEEQTGMPVSPLGPLTHPAQVEQDRHADRYVFDNHFGGIHQRLHRRVIGIPTRILCRALREIRQRYEKFLT